MNAGLRKWLDEEITVVDEDNGDKPVKVIRKDRLVHLIGVNGGIVPGGWGTIVMGGPFKRQGLHAEEAYELLQYGGFMAGVAVVDSTSATEVKNELNAAIRTIVEKFEAEFPDTDTVKTQAPS